MIVFISFVHFCALIEFKRQLNDVAREYLLKVETTGKLETAELQSFENDVNAIRPRPNGTYTVTVSYNDGSGPARYGENVNVRANVVASYDALGLTKIYSLIRDDYEFDAHYYSTSKQ